MQARVRDPATWRVFGVLMAGALVGVVAILPYVLTLLERLPPSVADSLPPLWVLLPLQLAQSLVLIGLATALGLWLGPKVGLGAPEIYGLVRRDRETRSRLRALLLPIRPARRAGRRGHRAARPVGVRAAPGRVGQLPQHPPATRLARAAGLGLRRHRRGAAAAARTDDALGLGRCPADPVRRLPDPSWCGPRS